MASKDLKFVVSGDSKGAQQAFKDAATEVKKLGDAQDDSKTKAQQFADAMRAKADEIEASLADERSAVDKLSTALGDEFVADVRAAGGSVDDLVGNLRAAGLTYDDVRADAEDLADAIRRVGDVGKVAGDDVKAGAKTADDGLRKVHDSSDQSRSVLANMVGNSAQDLGELGGIAGSAGVALGQLGEYAADGNIQLSNLAKVAGPLALVTGVTLGISKAMEQVARTDAFKRAQVDGYTDALKDASTVIDAVRDKLEKAGEVKLSVMDGIALDVIPTFNELGLSVEQFSELVAGGEPKIKAWADAMRAAGADGDTVTLAAVAAAQQVGFLEKAQDNAAASAKFFGSDLKDLESAAGDTESQIRTFSDAANLAAMEQDNAKRASEDLTGAIDALYGRLDEEDAWQRFREKMWNFHADTDISEQDTRDYIRSLADLVTQLDEVPDETKTQMIATLDEGNVAAIEARLALMARERVVSFRGQIVSSTMRNDMEGRANGGPVQAGVPYLVGERGVPEVFVPQQHGQMVQTNQVRGSAPMVHIENFNTYSDPRSTLDQIALALKLHGRN